MVPQQPNQRLGDDADFGFGRQVPVELSDGHHDLKRGKNLCELSAEPSTFASSYLYIHVPQVALVLQNE